MGLSNGIRFCAFIVDEQTSSVEKTLAHHGQIPSPFLSLITLQHS